MFIFPSILMTYFLFFLLLQVFLGRYLNSLPKEKRVFDAIVSDFFGSGAEIIVPELALESRINFVGFKVVDKKETSQEGKDPSLPPAPANRIFLSFEKNTVELRVFDVIKVEVFSPNDSVQLTPDLVCTIVPESLLALNEHKERDVEHRIALGQSLKQKVFPHLIPSDENSQRDPQLRM
jgi:hypothetical protein